MITHELISAQTIYVDAIVEYIYRVLHNHYKQLSQPKSQEQTPEAIGDNSQFDLDGWIHDFDEFFSTTNDTTTAVNSRNNQQKELNRIFPSVIVQEKHSGALFSCEDFVTALIKLNRIMYTENNSSEEKRKILFGIDQILP